jgi:hypothetical protein
MRRDSGRSGSGEPLGQTLPVDVSALISDLADLDPDALDEKASLAAISALEQLKSAAAAAQARLSVRVDHCARERQAAQGLRREKLGAGVGAQIALARHDSPHRGGRHLGLGKALVHELPHTLAAMTGGQVSEWRATLVARETACLEVETRRAIDEQIAGRLAGWGDAETIREIRKLAYAAEPGAVVRRNAQAVSERRVTIRPAPDTMCYLTALLPVTAGVATYAALVRAADSLRSAGDERGRGQVMVDTLVERATGQSSASDVPLEVELVMSTDTLLGESDEPAQVAGQGPIPAVLARRLVRDTKAAVWLRRLFVKPDSGQLVAMDSHRRRFEGQLRHLVVLRDQFCRTPWCDAPIRHGDHVRPHHDRGPTAAENAQGLCGACSYTKEAPGWSVEPTTTDGPHLVTITTPTGERYASQAPDPPGTRPGLSRASPGPSHGPDPRRPARASPS